MSNRQGVVKNEFMGPVQQAIGLRLRGQAIPPGSTYDQICLISAINSQSGSYKGKVPILDYAGVEKMTQFPYITIGDDDMATPDDTKGGSAEQILVAIHIWSRYNGKNETNFIGKQVLNLLTSYPIDMSANGFNCYGFKKEFDHTMKDGTNSTHRIIKFRMWVQDILTNQPL